MICVAVNAGQLVQDTSCSTGLVVATLSEMGGMNHMIQPLTASEAAQLGTSFITLMVLAWAMGRVIGFLWGGGR